MNFKDGEDSLSSNAWEPFFNKLEEEIYANDRIFCGKTVCKESKLIPDQYGVFARENLKMGECFEWGIATMIDDYNINKTDLLYIWDSNNKKTAATLSGSALFYNTRGDESNVRCVPYHCENRYEMYALTDIPKGTELTIRYDSMNWRKSFIELKHIINRD